MATTNVSPTEKAAPTWETLEQVGKEDYRTDLHIERVVERVRDKVAPVWPLEDYVAVNPFMGFIDEKFLFARESLRAVANTEMLMPVDFYRKQFAAGKFDADDIANAIEELREDGVALADQLRTQNLIDELRWEDKQAGGGAIADSTNTSRVIHTVSELIDQFDGSDWRQAVQEEITKHCSAHYDEGQAAWTSPWNRLPLYQAWRSAASIDRNFELQGVGGFRELVSRLPHHPDAALVALLGKLRVPPRLWEQVLLTYAYSVIGWSSWTKYQHRMSEANSAENTDFTALLAMRLAYDVALSSRFDFEMDWGSIDSLATTEDKAPSFKMEALERFTLLKACEIAFRKRLLVSLERTESLDRIQHEPSHAETPETATKERRLAQMVFCIDVRSEPMRRHLESVSAEVETHGFAGFFGMPIEIQLLGEEQGVAQTPVLLNPAFKVFEDVEPTNSSDRSSIQETRSQFRFLRKAWKEFQSSALSAFGFVETCGLLFGGKLLARTLGGGQAKKSRFDGLSADARDRLGPTLQGLARQGITPSKQVDLAESLLRGVGLVDDFARVVVLCGHGSCTENNPLQASLECGACGGHSGEANARFAVKLLNQKSIRQALVERGIDIGDDVRFVAGVHNTTTDELTFFDTHDLPATHEGDLEELQAISTQASYEARCERMRSLNGDSEGDLLRRSRDWSEVRPEWGLAGNAAFVAAPRDLTKAVSLEGRVFLHSYDYRKDKEFAVLEQIMTAPMVVAQWINMQYYASVVDHEHFGSGNKVVHNVVGRFGILSGNGGDLQTGLPWQSIHNGDEFQHQPLRLLTLLAAPRDAIENVVAKHELVANLLTNGWLHLVAVEEGRFYRYSESGSWERLPDNAVAKLTGSSA